MEVVNYSLLLVICVGLAYGFCTQESEKHGSSRHYDEDGEHNDEYDHEAVLGSQDEIDKFAQLSPEEAKKRLGELIDKMDTNKDGSIDTEELSDWIKSSFLRLNVEETKDRMDEDDKNEDGQITWAEYLQAIYSMTEEELQDYRKSDLDEEARKQFDISFQHAQARFRAADQNGDSQLNDDEYAAFNYPHDYAHMTEVEADRVIADYDKDGNGMVTEEEYLSNAAFPKKSEEDKVAESANFRFQDKNEDGALDKEEVKQWISPNLDEIVKEETAHLMTETDKDKDGQLTKDEILKEQELWVGSEATEYGDMLLNREEL